MNYSPTNNKKRENLEYYYISCVKDGTSGAYSIPVPVLPYTGHIQGAASHMGGKCDFALCLETISIYKNPIDCLLQQVSGTYHWI